MSPRPRQARALRLAVQDAALSRRKHGFDSRRARHFSSAITISYVFGRSIAGGWTKIGPNIVAGRFRPPGRPERSRGAAGEGADEGRGATDRRQHRPPHRAACKRSRIVKPKPHSKAHATQTIVVKRRGSTGILAGMLGCGFGAFGIVTLGIVFVPLAALCSAIGLLRGLAGLSASGIAVSLLGGVLAIVGFVFSPSLWLLPVVC
jgi:hypothetical protein